MTRTALEIGTVLQLGEKAYLITGCIGRGGSSLIYSAYNTKSHDEKVALKELYPNQGYLRDNSGQIVPLEDSQWTYEQLEKLKTKNRSAKVLSRQANDSNFHIFPVSDVFDAAELHYPDGSKYTIHNQYSVMNDLQRQGISLAQYIRQYKEFHRGSIPLSQIITLMETILDSYVPLHTSGFIHGDVQPGNIYLMDADSSKGRCGIACIIDFGEAWAMQENGRTEIISLDIPLFSTQGYTPPEIQFRKSKLQLTAAADVYSLGVLMLSLANGHEPYSTTRLFSCPYLKRIWDNETLDCSQATLGLLNRVLYKALENEPECRYQNAGEFLKAIYELKDCHNVTFAHGLTADTLRHAAEIRFHHKNLGKWPPSVGSQNSQGRLVAKTGEDKTSEMRELLDGIDSGGYLIETEFVDEYYSYLVGILQKHLEEGSRIPVLLDIEALTYDYVMKSADQQDILSYMLAEDLLGDTSEEAVWAMGQFLTEKPDEFCILINNFQLLSNESDAFGEDLKKTLQTLSKAGAQVLILCLEKNILPQKIWYSQDIANFIACTYSALSIAAPIWTEASSPLIRLPICVAVLYVFAKFFSQAMTCKTDVLQKVRDHIYPKKYNSALIRDCLLLLILAAGGGCSLWASSFGYEISAECARYAMYLFTTVTVLLKPEHPSRESLKEIPAIIYSALALAISKLTFGSFNPGLISIVLRLMSGANKAFLCALLSGVFVLLYPLLENSGIAILNDSRTGVVFLLCWVLIPFVVCYVGAWKLGEGKRNLLSISLLFGGIVAVCFALYVHPEIQNGRIALYRTDWIVEIAKLGTLFAQECHSTMFSRTLSIEPLWWFFANAFIIGGYFFSYFEHYTGLDWFAEKCILALVLFTVFAFAVALFTGDALPPNLIPGMALIYPLFSSALRHGERNLFANVTSL